MSRRELIRMSPAEGRAFLREARVITVASIGPGGRPHLMPLWFVVEDDAGTAHALQAGDAGAGTAPTLLAWTYASSQKVKNLERLPEATLLAEAGNSYEALRGMQVEADVDLIRDPAAVAEIGLAVALRYAPGDLSAADAPPELRAMIDAQATKRVGLRFIPTKVVSWDHRKLGGAY